MTKDFDTWNNLKKQIHDKSINFHIKERQIWWCALGVNVGSEQDGKNENFERPVLVYKFINKDMIFIIPFTGKEKHDRHHIVIDHGEFKSSLILSQLKVISSKRLLRQVSWVSEDVFLIAMQKIQEYFLPRSFIEMSKPSPGGEGFSGPKALVMMIIYNLKNKANHMDDYPIYKLDQNIIQDYFQSLPKFPKELFIRGTFPTDKHLVFLTVVGARECTSYGKEVCEMLIKGLKGYPVVIVSGLARGIDGIAHHAALEAGLTCIGFPGSGLGERVIYPRYNLDLAKKILLANGCLVSEYQENEVGNIWSFPKRNRLLAGISQATLIIEATHQSGSRITTKFATEYNRDVLAVPGSIFSEKSEAPNELIRMGAVPITNSQELLETLGFQVTEQPMLNLFSHCTPDEALILKILAAPVARGEVIRKLGMPVFKANILISQMEIKGFIKEIGGELRRL
jgi:DNA processing protein